ncbi:hypothetical protein [Streptomyces sp. NPDC051921]|uniref:hypothetical protein n=1 Tax=Streptomyces sp. NPDC051921 TaxID=3155806 RepID=UPI003434B5A7
MGDIDRPAEAVVSAVLSLMRPESDAVSRPSGSDTKRADHVGGRDGPSGAPGPTGESWRLVRAEQSAVVHVQVYTGDTLAEPERRRRGVAVEAMSCPPDAFRSGTDLTVLEPGATHVLRWGLNPWGYA